MRKLLISGLLVLLFLNIAGYYGIFLIVQLQNQQAMIHRFNTGDFNAAEIHEIKVPLTLPYPIQNNGYQRVDGEFEYGGKFYRLIRQKYSNDTLRIICIEDSRQKIIHRALADYVKTFTDKAVDTKTDAKIKVYFSSDYLGSKISISQLAAGWNYQLAPERKCKLLREIFLSIPSPPPENPTLLF